MQYLNFKKAISEVEVGSKVLFLADIQDAAAGTFGSIVDVSETQVTVKLNPVTQYQVESDSLCPRVTLGQAELNVLAFEGESSKLNAYVAQAEKPAEVVVQGTPAPVVEDNAIVKDAQITIDEAIDGGDTHVETIVEPTGTEQ